MYIDPNKSFYCFTGLLFMKLVENAKNEEKEQ